MNTGNISIEDILKAIADDDVKINDDADKSIAEINKNRSLKLAKNQGKREMARSFIVQNESKEIPQENEKKPRPTMKQIRDLSFEFINNNGDSGTDDILKDCEKKGYDITKQDIANALSQAKMFTFKRGENNSKKFGKWILKEENQGNLIIE